MDAADIETDEPPGSAAAGRKQAGPSHGIARPDVDVLDPDNLLGAAPRRWLTDHARAAVAHLGASGEVRVRVIADAEMATAHERYSNVPGTTDVLTFDLREDPNPEAPLDVDVLICADEARRQATARGVPVQRELLLYIVHAVLHCLGEGDHDEAAAARMHEREDRVLAAIGVGAVYAVAPTPTPPPTPTPTEEVRT